MSTIHIIPREISIILDSNPATGAIERTADGSAFSVQLNEPLMIPSNAINPILDVEESAIWYSSPNIFSSGTKQNNGFQIRDLNVGPTNYNLTIPSGLYSVITIQNAMNYAIQQALGITTNVIQLVSNESLGKIEMILASGFELDFIAPSSLGPILGFQTGITYVSGTVNVGQFTPVINSVNFYLVQCDLVSDGIRFNNQYRQIIESVLIDVPPRDLIITRPFNPPTIDLSMLAGNPRSKIRVQLLTDSFEPANTDGEYYYIRLAIRWLEPIKID